VLGPGHDMPHHECFGGRYSFSSALSCESTYLVLFDVVHSVTRHSSYSDVEDQERYFQFHEDTIDDN